MKTLDINEPQDVHYCVDPVLRDENIRHARNLKLPTVRPATGTSDEPVAIVCFGPSLGSTWEKIKQRFRVIFTCSGGHKFLFDKGLQPKDFWKWYHVEVDPREHKAGLIGPPHLAVEYLIASTCHPKVFDHLRGYGVRLWHVADNSDAGHRVIPREEWSVTGGMNVGLRAITLARLFGYTNLHIFGMDGCEGVGGLHAGEHPSQPEDRWETEVNGRKFLTTPAFAEAARQTFHELDKLKDVKVTFYGDGLVQEMSKSYVRNPNAKAETIAYTRPEVISSEMREQNADLHTSNPYYGVGGHNHAEYVRRVIAASTEPMTVLDYGCGKSTLAKSLDFPIWEYDPAIPGKDELPPPADFVVCTDVLEHVELEKLPAVLEDLKRCIRGAGYFVIATREARSVLPDGRNAHLIVESADWWEAQLIEYFKIERTVIHGTDCVQFVVYPKVTEDDSEVFRVTAAPPFQVFLGYDRREHAAYQVAKFSLERHSQQPVIVSPLIIDHLSHLVPPPIIKDGKMFDPESNAPQSTEFARSRFCVPFLHTRGWALFADSDVLFQRDIAELFALADDRYAVMVVKHAEVVCLSGTKMDGQVQTAYPRKNWSSVILWNCSHPAHARLTASRLAQWPGRDLHAFAWLTDDEIGQLPAEWNHLCSAAPVPKDTAIAHLTLGGPWLPNWEVQTEADSLWADEETYRRFLLHGHG
jgi:2-polyprenyl-3-methyl-5-hydroxy-6-metoxy-1,4-benzoquinol methylase